MAVGFNPYKAIQSEISQYSDMSNLSSKIKQAQGESKSKQRGHVKILEEKIKDIEAQIKKKKKKRGLLGGAFNIASLFVPALRALKPWQTALLGGVSAGVTSQSTKDMLKRMKSKTDALKSGTFADELIQGQVDSLQKDIDKYDPTKVALENAFLSWAGGKGKEAIGKGMDKIKSKLPSIGGKDVGQTGFSSNVNTEHWSKKQPTMDIQYGNAPTLKAAMPENVNPYSGNISSPNLGDVGVAGATSDISQNTFNQLATPSQSNFGQNIPKVSEVGINNILAQYMAGSNPAFAQSNLSDKDLLSTLLSGDAWSLEEIFENLSNKNNTDPGGK